ncbi:MAG: cytochrome c biogenesis protein CcdA [Candidatus Marinimicrobia bacterium]|nr:thiol:disulfide interchange protein [Candidatus Neomarinimicrobiota bacterium]MDP6142755.1 cytochrome c biogenesis protein CcdA [Candidatus Neomarinimicrobiota bacterium]MDP6260988.1 cytochrome c biogenesis protein CcdA [Candidatus Neomarinimicrobiota bacterium]MDP7337545.1 cytochrome c biogenesis protein CcdA [Candidatus Neomarinimicrobiota bacterium]MDP7474847.1 cytochrome c biogenesis protein CcdA [Candidatus Neomarinimicrobiota bacterium]
MLVKSNRKRINPLIVLLSVLFLSTGWGQADFISPKDVVSVDVFLSQDRVHRIEEVKFALVTEIKEGWHINANQVDSEFAIPTEIFIDSLEGVTARGSIFPEFERKQFPFSEDALPVFEGKINIITSLTFADDLPIGEVIVSGSIYYQACNDRICLPPIEIPWNFNIDVVNAREAVTEINQDLFHDEKTVEENDEDGTIGGWIQSKGMFITFILVFFGGLALNLTPCVYPLIPITVSYFANQSTGKISKSFVLALFYVLGMALTYSVLGVVAASTGSMLGSALQNPLVLIFISLVLVALSLSMFGLYEIRVPQSLTSVGGKSRQGIFGALFMGLTVGIIAAPCIGPFVLSLLIFVGEQGNPFLGFWLFFTLALGLGVPFLILGTFSGMISGMPRSGVWMVWVRKLFGVILIGMAVYFLEALIPARIYQYVLAVLLIVGGVYLGWIEKSTGGKLFSVFRWLVGIASLLFAVWLTVPEKEHQEINWETFDYKLLAQAKTDGNPVILDFYADWCIPCKELDHNTFTDEEVVELSKEFVVLKVDLTHGSDQLTKDLKMDFGVKGVPTIVFIGENGEEMKHLRFFGFIEAEEFLTKMKEAVN